MAPGERKPPRLLWKIETTPDMDRFTQIVPANGKLLAMRRGALYAFDDATGKQLWRFPKKGHAQNLQFQGQVPVHMFPPFVFGIRGDEIITGLSRGKHRDRGISVIRLADGTLVREFALGEDVPAFKSPYVEERRQMLPGGQIAFWILDRKARKTEICVVDIEKWKEIARFELPFLTLGDVHVKDDKVFGLTSRGEEMCSAFTVDLKTSTIYTVPVRSQAAWRSPAFLPDGSRLVPEGRLNARCGYAGLWPQAQNAMVAGDGVYVRDRRGFYRAEAKDGRELWRLYLGYPAVTFPNERRTWEVAAANDVAVLGEKPFLYVVDADKGKLRTAIRVDPGFTLEGGGGGSGMFLACDGPRVYVCESTTLAAYDTRPVDPAKPDPSDPGDPAWALARSRGALAKGDFEAGLKALWGIGTLTRLRPAQRKEAAELFSQLSRSPASTRHPKLWEDVMLHDGWVAGELFLDTYTKMAVERPEAVAALIAIGTERTLKVAEGLVEQQNRHAQSLAWALDAIEMRTGRVPLKQAAALKNVDDYSVFEPVLARPMDNATFEEVLPILQARAPDRNHWCRECLRPDRLLRLLRGGPGEHAEAAEAQVASQKRGEGEKNAIKIVRPEPEDPEEIF